MKNLSVRLHAYTPNGESLGYLPHPTSFSVSFIHDDNGALQFDYSRKALNGGILERKLESGLEIAVEVSDGGAYREPYNGRFILISRKRDALDDSDTVTFTCPSYGWLLNKALMLDLDHLESDGDDKGKRVFRKATAGTVMRTFMDENRARGGVPVICGFDTGKDSANAAWKSVMTLAYTPGISALTALNNLAANKICDWVFDKRTLLVYNLDSPSLCRDLSGMTIQLSPDILEAPEEESIENLASHILVQGDNNKAFTRDNPVAPNPYGKWDTYLSQQGISHKDTAALYMQSTLDTAARVRGQYTRTVRVNDSPILPLVDYRPGDWITAPTVRHGEKVRVQQVTLSLESGAYKASLVLNDKVYDSTVRQAKRVQGITGGALNGGTGGGIPAPEKDHRVPKSPQGLVVQTDAYIAANGAALGLATLRWAAVSQATDDTAIDVSGYRVEYRKNVAGAPWVAGGVTDGTARTLGIGGLECGVRYEFRVRAVPTYSDRLGDWSPSVVALVASDVTPPSVPSKPILTSKLGVVSVRWDGRNSVGAGMELDFDHCELGISASNGNWAYKDRVQGDGYCHVTGLELNSTWWFALRSVDHSGNKSDWSEGASVKVAPAVTQEDLNASAEDILSKAHEDAAKQVAVTDKKVAANTAAIQANKGEQEKADAVIRSDLKATQDKVKANTDANTAQQQQIDATKTALDKANKTISQHTQSIANAQKQADAAKQQAETNADKIEQNTVGLGKVQEHQAEVDKTVAGNTAAIDKARADITSASSKAQQALDKANSVGKSLDGLHNIYEGPDDPTTLEGVTVNQGDFWYRTQKYWTRWSGAANNSTSLLADFYTYWTGTPNNSPSVLVPLSSRFIGVYVWDGSQWNERNLVAANILATGSVVADNMAANSITTEKIAAGSITADKIKGNLLSGTTVEGGVFRTLNSRLVINDTGILLKDAKGAATLTALTSDGSVTMRGALTSGSTITGTTITGSRFTTTGRHVDISDDGMVFTDADGNPVLTWAPIKYWTRWQGEANNSPSLLADFYTEWLGEPNNSPSRLTSLEDKWRLAMDAPVMSSATISGSTLKGGVIEGAEYRGLKPDGTRYLTINSSGMTMGDKLAYDSAKGQLTIQGMIKASTLTGSTITTTNGRMLWNDTGLVLKDAKGNPTLTMKTSDGSIALKGSITSGSTLSGVTVTGSTIQTSGAGKRGIKLTSGGLVGYGADGNAKFTLDTNGNLKTDGGVIANGTLTAVNIKAGTIDGTTITGSTITTGLIKDKAGLNSWNLTTGELQLSAGTSVGGKTVKQYSDDAAQSAIDAADAADRSLSSRINGVDENVDNLGGVINDEITRRRAYMTFGSDADGDPVLELGASSNANKVQITNTRMRFLSGGTEVAYVASDNLYISNATVTGILRIGGFAWKVRGDGHLSLVKL